MQKMDVGCGPYKKLLDNFHQSELPYPIYMSYIYVGRCSRRSHVHPELNQTVLKSALYFGQ